MAQFTFTTTITKGRYEREVEVEVTYRADLHGPAEIIDAKAPCHLTEADYDWLTDIAADRADDDYADWLADQCDMALDMARDRAAESYIPPMGAA